MLIDADPIGGALLLQRESRVVVAWQPETQLELVEVRAPTATAQAVAVSARERRLLWHDGSTWLVSSAASETIVQFPDDIDHARFCLDGRAVCARHIYWLDPDHPSADRDPLRSALQLDTGSCLAFVGDDDARLVSAACTATVPVGEITGLRCARECDRFAVGTRSGEVRWARPGSPATTLRLARMPVHDVAWADDDVLVVATRPGTLIDGSVSPSRIIPLWPSDVDTVSAFVNQRWAVLGGDDQVLRLYLRSIDDLVALAKATAGRELSTQERVRWRIAD